MNITIRRATADDARGIAYVICESWKSAYRGIIPSGELSHRTDTEARAEFFERLLKSGADSFILALDCGSPCGACSFRPSRDADMQGWGEVVAIYTLEAYWGRSVGRALMDAATDGLRTLGFEKIMLWTFEANARARRFYERYGFAVDGTVKDSGIAGAPEVRYRLVLPL